METTENFPNEQNTLTNAIDEFRELGYRAEFRVDNGKLISESCDEKEHEPEGVLVEDFRRFEGVSDPGDESVVFAVRCRAHGTPGILSASYGPSADPDDQDVVLRLGKTH